MLGREGGDEAKLFKYAWRYDDCCCREKNEKGERKQLSSFSRRKMLNVEMSAWLEVSRILSMYISISSLFTVVRMIFVHVYLTDAFSSSLSTMNWSWPLTQMTQFPFVSPIICTLSIHLGMVTFYFYLIYVLSAIAIFSSFSSWLLPGAQNIYNTIYNSAEYLWRKVFRMSKFAINIKIKQPTERREGMEEFQFCVRVRFSYFSGNLQHQQHLQAQKIVNHTK